LNHLISNLFGIYFGRRIYSEQQNFLFKISTNAGNKLSKVSYAYPDLRQLYNLIIQVKANYFLHATGGKSALGL